MNLEIFFEAVRFAVIVMTPMIYVGLFIWAVNVVVADTRACYQRFFIDLPRRCRGKQMLERARKVGCVVVFNFERGITAITPRADFDYELAIEEARIEGEKNETKKFKRLLYPSLVMPSSTFTFASRDEGNRYVTGTELDMEILAARIVLHATGYSRGQVPSDVFKEVRYILTRRDKRLLVPFLREGTMANGELMLSLESQVKFCGGKTMEEARKCLLSCV